MYVEPHFLSFAIATFTWAIIATVSTDDFTTLTHTAQKFCSWLLYKHITSLQHDNFDVLPTYRLVLACLSQM